MRKRAERSLTPVQRSLRDERIGQLHISTASMLKNRAY